MTKGQQDIADMVAQTFQPADVAKERDIKKPKGSPREARTRKDQRSQGKKESVVNNIHNHVSRLNVALNTMDDMSTFWNQFKEANPSKRDAAMMTRFVDNMLGRRFEAEPVAEILKKSTSFFWRFHFFNPAKAAYFFTRNLMQNAYMGSQMSLGQVTKAGKQLMQEWRSGNHDQQRVESFEKFWRDSISQKQGMWEQAMMIEAEQTATGKLGNKLKQKIFHLADTIGSMAIKSDSINRSVAWNVYYTGAKQALDSYNKGDINWKQFQKKLKLNTLHFSQRTKLMNTIQDPDAFLAEYASYKTENTHFRYETALRSGAEQSTLSRALAGLMVYPRGVANILVQNGVRPMFEGMKTGNYNQAYSGLKSILAMMVGTGVAREALKMLTGRDSYTTMPEWQPLGPGVTLITDTIKEIYNVKYRLGEGQLTHGEAVEEIVGIAADQVELVIPLVDVFVDAAESVGDKSGMRFSRSVMSALKKEYPDYTYQDRNFWEKIAHVLFSGGFEEIEDE